jgi:hypothetical protein
MSNPFHKGEWFLPGSELKLPGRLVINEADRTIRLELFGNRYLDDQPIVIHDPERAKKYHSKNYNENYATTHSFILGKAAGLITLYRCRYYHVEDISDELYIIQYEAEYVFWGAHILSAASFLIGSATFIYPYLSSWYEGEGSHDKLHRDDHSSPFDKPCAPLEDTIPVTDGVSIQLTESYHKRSNNFGVHEETQYQMYLTFRYVTPAAFDQVLVNAHVFAKLMQFCHGKPLEKSILSVTVDKERVHHKEDRWPSRTPEPVNLRITNFSLQRGEDVSRHTQHQRYMLLSGWIMERSELNTVIRQWFANSAYYGLYDFYLDSNNWLNRSEAVLSNVMFNNRFLNIIQGLEAYYRKSPAFAPNTSAPTKPTVSRQEFERNKTAILEKLDKGSPLKTWFNGFFNYKPPRGVEIKLEEILTELIAHLRPILDPLLGKNEVIEFFPRFASVTRNHLSHGTHVKTDQGDALPIFFYAGQLLLGICILKTLNVAEIGEKVSHYDAFQQILYQLQRTKLAFQPSAPTSKPGTD